MDNSLEVTTLTLGALDTNCYIVSDPETDECVIIDPADSGDFISETILSKKVKPSAIILTHGHFDHVLGSLELHLNFDLPVYMHPKDSFLLQNAQKSAKHWVGLDVDPPVQSTKPLHEGNSFFVGSHELLVFESPGHTPGSILLFVDEEQPLLFTGDTLFKQGVGRTDFSYASPIKLQASLKKIFSLFPDQAICYPGHGESTILLAEK